MPSGIFDKQAGFKPSAMKAVAERRFDDAEMLRKTNDNARANGAAYLVGFVIEILLKAKLIEKYSSIAKLPQHALKDDQREIWSLIWRRHDLEGMLSQLAELEAYLKTNGERDGYDYLEQVKKLCATLTIQARYSSRMMSIAEAGDMVDRVRRLKEVLK